MPPILATSSRQYFSCSGSLVKISSGPMLTRASGPGLTGNGCVGQVCSPGTSLCGTGRSSTGYTERPVSRSRKNMYPPFETATTTGIRLPSRVTSSSAGAAEMS